MSGAVFAAKGASTGQAATTSFFGPIPDNYNVLMPAHEDQTFGYHVTTQLNGAANNVNQWERFNQSYKGGSNVFTISLGGMTSAPDGTNQAQKIVEAAVTDNHYMTAAFVCGCAGPYPLRLAVFLKKAERTRAVLAIGNNAGDSVKTVFDLNAGTVAVPGAVSGSNWTAIADYIVPFGNGWYLCMIDVRVFQTSLRQILGYVYIDAGSGNAAINTNYAGDGSSGIYTWRSCMLPPLAFGMTGQPLFFDGFDDPTLSEMDMNDTQQPGFKWYTHETFPFDYGTSRGSYSGFGVSGSILQIQNGDLRSACWLGPEGPTSVFSLGTTYALNKIVVDTSVALMFRSLSNGNVGNQPATSPTFWAPYPTAGQYTGNVFPMTNVLIESNVRNPQVANSYTVLFYVGLNTFLTTQDVNNNKFLIPADTAPYFERDIHERAGGNQPDSLIASQIATTNCATSSFNHITKLSNFVGYSTWLSTITYNNGNVVGFNGQLYQVSVASSLNQQPDINPGSWNVYSPDGTQPDAAHTLIYDGTAAHTHTMLQTSYTKTDNGMAINFTDGVPTQLVINTSGVQCFGPTCATDNNDCPFWWISLQQPHFLILAGDVNPSFYDYVKVLN